MLSGRVIKIVKRRFAFMKYIGGAYVDYDKKTDKIAPCNIYYEFFLFGGSYGGGASFILIHSINLYLQTGLKEIPEDLDNSSATETTLDLFEFGRIALSWGEMGVVWSCLGVSFNVWLQQRNIAHLYNSMFLFHETLTKMLADKNIELDRKHKMGQMKLEGEIAGASIFSVTIGWLVLLALFSPLEPTNKIFEEWLEIPMEVHPKIVPFLIMLEMGLEGCANAVIVVGLMVMLYVPLATTCMNDLTVERVCSRSGSRCVFQTRFYGDLDDQEIVRLYRIQRYLNIRVNEIMGTVLISFHQVGMLACGSIMLYYFIKFQEAIWETGPIACVVVVGCLVTPLMVCSYQSMYFGKLVDISDDFVASGLSISPRKSMFRRFLRSCQTFYVEEAYPFFHYHKNTLLEFSAAVVDYAINLLLW